MFQRQLAADVGVPNAHGVVEQGIDVLKQAQPLKEEKPGTIARYSSSACKIGCYVIAHATNRSFTPQFEARVGEVSGEFEPVEPLKWH